MKKETKKIPELRFKEFEGEWEEKKLGDRGEFFSGGTPSTSKQNYFTGAIPFIRSAEINSNKTALFITEEGLEKSSAKMINMGDLIYALYGATSGQVGISKIKGAINQAILCIRTDLDNIFLYNYLFFKKDHLRRTYLQGGQGNFSANIIKSLQVYSPSLLEQQKISSFLTLVDKKIELLNKKKELLEKYKKGVMQKIFKQEIRFKDENGNEFPEWEEKKLGEVGFFKTSSVDKKMQDDEKEVFLINYMDVYKHRQIDKNNLKTLMRVTAKDNQRKENNLIKGDMLFTPSSETPSDIGHSIVIFEDLPNTLYSYHLLRFRPKIKLDPVYQHYFCNSTEVLNQIVKMACGATRFTVSLGSFNKIKVQIPLYEDQIKIGKYLQKLDKNLEKSINIINFIKDFKKSLLQKMFI